MGTQSICGTDDRVISQERSVGFVRSHSGDVSDRFCTLTLISESCALTAGHCLHHLDEAEFFDSDFSTAGNEKSAHPNRYKVDKSSIRALQSRIGNDWSVVNLQPHPVTGVLPGKVHGFTEVELNPQTPLEGSLEIHSVQRNTQGRHARVSARGEVLWTDGSILFHDLDTAPGSSGSLVVDAASGRAVAIHTHGGCDTMKNNKATIIARAPYLVKAIKACFSRESRQ
jgi:V8-like Glu-specific endopeptidase